jgi:hypothetical protein
MPIKNQAVTLTYLAWDTLLNQPKPGDAANHTIKRIVDGAAAESIAASPVERENGEYSIALTAGENDGDMMVAEGSSSTGNVIIVPTRWANLPTTVANTGTGARTVTVTVNDGTNPLESARIRFTKAAETRVGTTDSSGQCTFNLDDGDWTAAITLSGHDWDGTGCTTPTTKTQTVDGDKTPTYSMTAVSCTPSEPGQVTGYLYCYDEDGNVESGITVESEITEAAEATGCAYDTATKTVTSDATGKVEITGIFKGATYRLRRSGDKWYSVTIPSNASDPYELTSILGNP